ncbi:hypothetical protein AHAS_Ahas05G0158400 [Arachis hypogaea]
MVGELKTMRAEGTKVLSFDVEVLGQEDKVVVLFVWVTHVKGFQKSWIFGFDLVNLSPYK